MLYGDTLVVEYYLPREVEESGIISIAGVVHGYRYINIPSYSTQSLGSSGGCQVNVNCPEGANWQEEKNAVALILVNGNRYCTGSLTNTTCNDDRPLFLTADHCLGGWANSTKHDAITSPNLPHWSFYWHYESPSCTNPNNEPPHLSTVGAMVVANNGNTDFALLQLTEDPKNRNNVIPYYLGWDRSGNAGTGGVGIHHPSGDIKKISTYNGTPTNSLCMGGLNANFWQTGFVATTNGHSIMEPGSSGSALINSDRKVIGQLLGPGDIELCPEHLCGNNPSLQRVSYGKFSVSWTGGGATDNRRRLDHWLNPGGGTAPNTIDGKAATIISGPASFCSSAIYTLDNLPAGATINSWTASPTNAVTFSGSGNSRTVTKVGGFHGSITLTVTLGAACGDVDIIRTVQVIDMSSISGTYNSPSNSKELLVPPPPKVLNWPGNAACVALITNITVPSGSTVSWSGTADPGVTWYQTGNNVFVNFTALDQIADLSISITNSCGSYNRPYRFRCTSMNTCGVQPL